MSLLTKDEYKALAAGLEFPTMAFVDGGYRPASSGETFATVNPATGAELARRFGQRYRVAMIARDQQRLA